MGSHMISYCVFWIHGMGVTWHSHPVSLIVIMSTGCLVETDTATVEEGQWHLLHVRGLDAHQELEARMNRCQDGVTTCDENCRNKKNGSSVEEKYFWLRMDVWFDCLIAEACCWKFIGDDPYLTYRRWKFQNCLPLLGVETGGQKK